MKILFFLGHPAHFHLFKHVIHELSASRHEVHIVIKKKDILEQLLKLANLPYTNLLPEGRKDGKLGIIIGVLKKNKALLSYCREHKPDIMTGTSAEIAHIGKLLWIPSLNFTEDDYHIVRNFGRVTYPFTDTILSPMTCDNGRWNKKTVTYMGYHKLAYLHPNRFTPDKEIVRKYIPADKPYFILRFAKLNAHHDNGILGMDDELARKVVDKLSEQGNVYITSERELAKDLEPYRLQINLLDIHHIMAFTTLFIGDSQSMSVEAAMLGTPSIRFSSFTGRIGVLEELENKYELTYGIHPSCPEQLLSKIDELISDQQTGQKFQERRKIMLEEKIDVSAFFSWFLENYPDSYRIIKEDPEYQKSFQPDFLKL